MLARVRYCAWTIVVMMAIAGSSSARAELINNGGFELPATNGATPTGWTSIPDSFGTFDGGGVMLPHSGSRFLHAGLNWAGNGVYQDVTTVVNQSYTLKFWAVGYPTTDPASAAVQGGIAKVGTPSNNTLYANNSFSAVAYQSVTDWQQFSLSFTATTTTTRITLLNAGTGPLQLGGNGFAANIDDVSLLAASVPEPSSALLFSTASIAVLCRRRNR